MPAMKTVKKTSLKHSEPSGRESKAAKGTGQDKPVMKKPASKQAEGYASLTEATLAKLEGASDAKIEEFLLKLSDKEQMCLWKKFESQRKQDGTDEQYRKAVAGHGSRKKSVKCLKVYLKTGGNTKDALFQDLVTKVSGTRGFEEKSVWQPLNYMLQKFGMKELKARVLAGTIECRKNPHDPRFPEFREFLESSSRAVLHEKSTEVNMKKKATLKDFNAIANMDLKEMHSIEFADDGEDEDTAESMMKNFFGKASNQQGKALPIEDKQTDEHGEMFFKDLETASAVGDTTPLSVATLKLLQVKTLLQTLQEELSELEKVNPKHKEPVKKSKAELKSQMEKLTECEKQVKAKTAKAGVMKKVIVMAAGIGKKIKQWILKVS